MAEYEAVLLGLRKVAALGARRVRIRSDSQVLAMQVEKEYEVREPELAEYLRVVRGLEKKFQGFTITHVPRAENTAADTLANAAA